MPSLIAGGRVRRAKAHVKEILATYFHSWIVTNRKPNLGAMSGIEIIRRSRSSHFGRHPTGFQRIRENARPAPCDRERQQHIMQLGVGVCLLPLPRTVFPSQVLQACITASVEAGTQVHETLRSVNQRSQDVRSERVHGKDMRQAVFGLDAARLSIPDPGIVDHCVERAEGVDLLRDVAGLPDAREISDDDCFRLRNGLERFLAPLPVACVQNNGMPLLDQELSGHPPETIGRACDEHARHCSSPLA